MYVRSNSTQGLGAATSAANALIGAGVSAGVALATDAAAMWLSSIQLSHAADTATTQIVNGLEPLLNSNKNAYLNGPGTCLDQAAALATYDTAIMWLRSPKACGQGSFGSAGNRCISDRIGSGAKFPWDTWYRDPIANDPRAAGCAAALAVSNPDAAQQAAMANVLNLVGGSMSQTTAGVVAAGGASPTVSTAGGLPVSVSALPSFFTQVFLGLPLWMWLVAVGVLVMVI